MISESLASISRAVMSIITKQIGIVLSAKRYQPIVPRAITWALKSILCAHFLTLTSRVTVTVLLSILVVLQLWHLLFLRAWHLVEVELKCQLLSVFVSYGHDRRLIWMRSQCSYLTERPLETLCFDFSVNQRLVAPARLVALAQK